MAAHEGDVIDFARRGGSRTRDGRRHAVVVLEHLLGCCAEAVPKHCHLYGARAIRHLSRADWRTDGRATWFAAFIRQTGACSHRLGEQSAIVGSVTSRPDRNKGKMLSARNRQPLPRTQGGPRLSDLRPIRKGDFCHPGADRRLRLLGRAAAARARTLLGWESPGIRRRR